MDPELLRQAAQQLQAKRFSRARNHREKLDDIYKEYPCLVQWQEKLRELQISALESSVNGDPASAERAQKESYTILGRRAEFLSDKGYGQDVLYMSPECPVCGDTGYIGVMPCECLKKQCALLGLNLIRGGLPLSGASFETFDLSLFSDETDPARGISPRENMRFAYDICKNYARTLSPGSGKNLFFNGETGLGKTFLSCCIARMAAERGFLVRYESAADCFAEIEAEKFYRINAEQSYISRLLECQLLILDDLGTEFMPPSGYGQSALYRIVNTRLSAAKPTIVSSNLTFNDLKNRYTPQVVSRLTGAYELVFFFGKDVRVRR